MINRQHRAWRFAHPDFDPDQPGFALGPTGGISMIDADASIRQAVLLLLSTRPGERVMRPDYGCDLHRLVFAVNDNTTAGLAIHYVRRALERWEPRIDILDLDASANEQDPARLDILLEYRARTTRSRASLRIPVDLMPTEL